MTNPLIREIRRQHPPFMRAVAADARTFLAYRAEPSEFTSRARLILQIARLCWVADAYLALFLYRARVRLQRFHIPVIPTLFHRLSMLLAQVCIGDPVVVEPGIYLPHGQVVIDGFTRVGKGAVIAPWVTLGLKAGVFTGPTVGAGVHIGTGAKLIGPITVGNGAVIGANSVLTRDVAEGSTVVGIPARPVRDDAEREG